MKDDKLEPILIPMIKNVTPSLIADDIVGVQPLAEPIEGELKLEVVINPQPRVHKVGDLVHDFVYGYMRWDGTEFIDEQLYWDLKIKGLL